MKYNSHYPIAHIPLNATGFLRLIRMPSLVSAMLLSLLIPLFVSAQDGSSAYNYLNVTSSARIYGLGGVNITAVEDELGVADQNPALLGWELEYGEKTENHGK